MMEHRTADCPDEDVARRYVARAMQAAEADSFEAHYFECDRCFDAVEQALELRASLAPTTERRRQSGWRRWGPLAAAASIGFVAIGLWVTTGPGPDPIPTLRGERQALAVTVEAAPGSLTVSWPAVAGAETYAVELFTADGVLVHERETAERSLRLSLEPHEAARELLIRVRALDPLREIKADSGLIEAR